MFKITVYIPTEDKERVKSAMFAAGAGKIGNYDSCCFEVAGTGQFRPLENSHPQRGKRLVVEYVPEVRVEMVLEPQYLQEVVAALKSAHPYETPAFDVIRLESKFL